MAEKKNKIPKGTIILVVIAVLIIALLAVFTGVVFNVFDFDEETTKSPDAEFVDFPEDDEHITSGEVLSELRDAETLSDLLKEWALSGDENNYISNKKIHNFLLIGCDEGGYNTDVIMLVSVNTLSKTIYLSSFLRDCYTYISTSSGGRFAKINAAYSNGGATKLIETIQNDYKIKIDHYVTVNFNSFIEIVNILGGVTLNVQLYEAQAVGLNCPYGENVTLNAEQALMFCRIRKCDSDGDVSRTRRQRQFVSALISKAKDISLSQAKPIIDTLFRYVKTDCSSTDIMSFATQALMDRWYNYKIESSAIPLSEDSLDYSGNAWVWIVDYPLSAKKLQEKIYGESNIMLNDDRLTAIDIMRRGNTGNAAP